MLYNLGMSTISVEEIHRDPVGFVKRMEEGEALLVVRGQRALAEVRPISPSSLEPRPYGLAAGQFRLPDDFDQPLPENILAEFEGQ